MEGRGFHLLLRAAARVALHMALLLSAPALLHAEQQAGEGQPVPASQPTQPNQPNENIPLDEPIVKPKVERRVIEKVAIDSENLELGIYSGFYSADRYGTGTVSGVRVAYHISEDLFFEATGGQTNLKRPPEQGLLQYYTIDEKDLLLKYYSINIGYNILPGEVFFSDDWAFNFAFYLLGGVGNTDITGEQRSTLTTGVGMRVLLTDWMAVHFNMRDHIMRHSYLGGVSNEETIHNLETFTSVTFFF